MYYYYLMKQLVVRSWYSDKRLYVIKRRKRKTNMNILLLLDLSIVLNSIFIFYILKYHWCNDYHVITKYKEFHLKMYVLEKNVKIKENEKSIFITYSTRYTWRHLIYKKKKKKKLFVKVSWCVCLLYLHSLAYTHLLAYHIYFHFDTKFIT